MVCRNMLSMFHKNKGLGYMSDERLFNSYIKHM